MMKEIQLKLAKKVKITDFKAVSEIKTIGGVDVAYSNNFGVACLSILDFKTLKIQELYY